MICINDTINNSLVKLIHLVSWDGIISYRRTVPPTMSEPEDHTVGKSPAALPIRVSICLMVSSSLSSASEPKPLTTGRCASVMRVGGCRTVAARTGEGEMTPMMAADSSVAPRQHETVATLQHLRGSLEMPSCPDEMKHTMSSKYPNCHCMGWTRHAPSGGKFGIHLHATLPVWSNGLIVGDETFR